MPVFNLSPRKSGWVGNCIVKLVLVILNNANPYYLHSRLELSNEVSELELSNEVSELELSNEVSELELSNEVSELELSNEVSELELSNEVRA